MRAAESLRPPRLGPALGELAHDGQARAASVRMTGARAARAARASQAHTAKPAAELPFAHAGPARTGVADSRAARRACGMTKKREGSTVITEVARAWPVEHQLAEEVGRLPTWIDHHLLAGLVRPRRLRLGRHERARQLDVASASPMLSAHHDVCRNRPRAAPPGQGRAAPARRDGRRAVLWPPSMARDFADSAQKPSVTWRRPGAAAPAVILALPYVVRSTLYDQETRHALQPRWLPSPSDSAPAASGPPAAISARPSATRSPRAGGRPAR